MEGGLSYFKQSYTFKNRFTLNNPMTVHMLEATLIVITREVCIHWRYILIPEPDSVAVSSVFKFKEVMLSMIVKISTEVCNCFNSRCT